MVADSLEAASFEAFSFKAASFEAVSFKAAFFETFCFEAVSFEAFSFQAASGGYKISIKFEAHFPYQFLFTKPSLFHFFRFAKGVPHQAHTPLIKNPIKATIKKPPPPWEMLPSRLFLSLCLSLLFFSVYLSPLSLSMPSLFLFSLLSLSLVFSLSLSLSLSVSLSLALSLSLSLSSLSLVSCLFSKLPPSKQPPSKLPPSRLLPSRLPPSRT